MMFSLALKFTINSDKTTEAATITEAIASTQVTPQEVFSIKIEGDGILHSLNDLGQCQMLTTFIVAPPVFIETPKLSSTTLQSLTQLIDLELYGIIEFEEQAFSTCGELKTLKLNSVTTLTVSTGILDALETLELNSVSEIPANFFSQNDFPLLKTLSVTTCKTIKARAFANLPKLETLIGQVEAIDDFAFSGSEIKTIDLSKVKKIGKNCFEKTTQLLEPVFDSLTEAGECCFAESKIKQITADSLKIVPPYFCYKCEDLLSPKFVQATVISIRAFSQCPHLAEAIFPVIEKIETQGFMNTNIEDVHFPTVTDVAHEAFSDSQTKTVSLENIAVLDFSCFHQCKHLKTVLIPKVTQIYGNAFGGCSKLVDVKCDTLLEVGDHAFIGCSLLPQIDLSFCTKIQCHAFENCLKLEKVDAPKLTELNEYAFAGCKKLKEVTIGAKTLIGDHQFEDCTTLATITLPSLEVVSKEANNIFKGCPLVKITLLSKPPTTFHPKVFADADQSLSLILPKESDYRVYDNSILIDGDIAGDSKWCGIKINVPEEKKDGEKNNTPVVIGSIIGVVVAATIIIGLVIYYRKRTYMSTLISEAGQGGQPLLSVQ